MKTKDERNGWVSHPRRERELNLICRFFGDLKFFNTDYPHFFQSRRAIPIMLPVCMKKNGAGLFVPLNRIVTLCHEQIQSIVRVLHKEHRKKNPSVVCFFVVFIFIWIGVCWVFLVGWLGDLVGWFVFIWGFFFWLDSFGFGGFFYYYCLVVLFCVALFHLVFHKKFLVKPVSKGKPLAWVWEEQCLN